MIAYICVSSFYFLFAPLTGAGTDEEDEEEEAVVFFSFSAAVACEFADGTAGESRAGRGIFQ